MLSRPWPCLLLWCLTASHHALGEPGFWGVVLEYWQDVTSPAAQTALQPPSSCDLSPGTGTSAWLWRSRRGAGGSRAATGRERSEVRPQSVARGGLKTPGVKRGKRPGAGRLSARLRPRTLLAKHRPAPVSDGGSRRRGAVTASARPWDRACCRGRSCSCRGCCC